MKFIYLFLMLILFLGCSSNDQQKQYSAHEAFFITFSPHKGAGIYTPVPTSARLILQASVPLDVKSIDSESIYILNPITGDRPTLHVEVVNMEGEQYVIITPISYLHPNHDYTLIVTTDVATIGGKHRTSNIIIKFKTDEGDTTPPALIGTLPDNNSSDVEPYTSIYFQFTEDLFPLTDTKAITVYDENNAEINGTLSLSGALLSFVPESNLSNSSSYTVELNTSTIEDLSGNSYGDTVINTTFTTVDIPTTIVPFDGQLDYNLSAQANCIINDGSSYLYIGTEDGFDILEYKYGSDTTKPHIELRSHLENIGHVYSIELNATSKRAYVGSSTGFSIIDTSNKENTTLISHWDNFGLPVFGVSVVADHAYLAASSRGVIDLNISNENLPKYLRSSSEYQDIISFDIHVWPLTEETYELVGVDYTQGPFIMDKELQLKNGFSLEVPIEAHNIIPINRLFSAGISGIGILSSDNITAYTRAASYVTRVTELSGYSMAIIEDIGIGVFDSNNENPKITPYIKTNFKVSAIGYLLDQNTQKLVFIISDTQGHLYIRKTY